MLTEQVINQQELLDAVAQGATVLTGNNRLANALIDKFDRYNVVNKKTAWSSPDIIPINSWLIKNWEQAIFSEIIPSDKILLSSEQEYQIWEAIITESSYGNGLLRTSATAKSVSDAWRLLQNWNLARDNSDYQNNDDARAFHYWSTEFEKRCNKEQWIVNAQLASLDFYPEIISKNEILLIGFDELSPQLQSLFERLEASSVFTGSIKWLRQENIAQTVTRLECADVRDEIKTFTFWAKQRLEENPSSSIAVVAPDISSIRSILLNTLESILIPSSCIPRSLVDAVDKKEKLVQPWDISLGLPLSNYSLIKVAFQLLGIVQGKISIEIVSSLLRSPHIAGATEELNQRALLDRQIRELGEPLVSLKTLVFYSGQTESTYFCPLFLKLIKQLIELRPTCMNKAETQQWTIWLSKWLIAAGWGTGRSISSDEYQVIEAWKVLLQSFISLQTVTNKMTFKEALSCLHRLASDRIFQVQTKSAPIQILGLYESIGLNFDFLWIMNIHDEVWPMAPRPNPFIPLQIQKKFGLPHASWERELVIAKQITKRLKNSARNVVFSYPAKNGVLDLRCSPLIKAYEKTTKQALSLTSNPLWLQVIKQHSKQEKLESDTVVGVSSEKVSGGSTIFKNQSLCPFRAFVENRLHAKPMRKTQPGLDAMKRGSLLHIVLERFWKTITNQDQLKSKSTQQLEIIINHCINEAITEMATSSPDTFSDCFTRIEKQRLLKLTLNWLELEILRAPFKVLDTEREITINVNGVKAHLFIDRVDELENGHQMVIDYKTGQVSPADWFGERPNDPQLPLYSMAYGDNLSAVLFAQIKTGDVKFNGVVEQSDLIPDLPSKYIKNLKEATDNWPKVLTEWETVIKSLANNFIQGHIEIDPKNGLSTCKKLYCELSAICRINELIQKNGPGSSDQKGNE
ncbi:MAG: PD-(D/E)XK nuclease family protein [Thiohalomonadales bacterium]